MKKIITIASALIFSFTSCSDDDSGSTPAPPTSAPIQQEVSQDITLDEVTLATPGAITETITVNIETITALTQSTLGAPVIEDILFNDLVITLADGSEQTNFDFLDSLTATVTSDVANSNSIELDFGTVAKGLDELVFPSDVNSTSLLNLIQADGVSEIIINLDFITNTAIDSDLELEVTSNIIALLAASL